MSDAAAERAVTPEGRGDASGEALEAAYRLLESPEPLSKRGLATHAPMVAEALCALGHCDRAVRWVEEFRAPLRQLPPPSDRIDPRNWRAALPYDWQAAAAIYSNYARPGDERREPAPKRSASELIARAFDSNDAHAIKFTEVMLAEHKLNPDPAYLAAAEDAVERL